MNLRTVTRTDLQSAPFSHLDIPPCLPVRTIDRNRVSYALSPVCQVFFWVGGQKGGRMLDAGKDAGYWKRLGLGDLVGFNAFVSGLMPFLYRFTEYCMGG